MLLINAYNYLDNNIENLMMKKMIYMIQIIILFNVLFCFD